MTFCRSGVIISQCKNTKRSGPEFPKLKLPLFGKRTILLPVSEGGVDLEAADANDLFRVCGMRSLSSGGGSPGLPGLNPMRGKNNPTVPDLVTGTGLF